jgi:hypothetical protein
MSDPSFAPQALAHAGAIWAFRAGAELDASARFARLAITLARAEANAIVIDMARSAAADELRHHARCCELARRFATVPPPLDQRTAAPLRGDGSRGAREQVLVETVAMGCVTETLSTALLIEIRENAIDDHVADVVGEILEDEVDHSRLGWAHLAAEAGRGDVGFLAPLLPAMLGHTVHEEIFGADDDSAHPEVAGLGGLARAERRSIFVATMTEVVFPGLRRYGVDTAAGESWLAARVVTRVGAAAASSPAP